jgi:uncharacterized protein YbjT (DUF2867 family)
MEKLERVLVTGTTGYIGGRLVSPLLERGYSVRVMARDPQRLEGRDWLEQVEAVQGDVFKPETLEGALAEMDAAYYLIHSLEGGAFAQRDLEAATAFGEAAAKAGVKRIIYLGGLGNPEAELSEHLRSRQETGRALRTGGVPVTEFRAAIIVGAGSISFEMVRYLTERLPVMITPRWVNTRIQPISADDVIAYLVSALETPESSGETIEIGGADVLRYAEMMMQYAKARGLRRLLIPVPVLTPLLSSYWVHLITPAPAKLARPLIEGLRNEVIVHDDKAKRLFPHIKPVAYAAAVQRALADLNAGHIESTWSDSLTSSMGDITPVAFVDERGMLIERRQKVINASPEAVYRVCARIGGQNHWPVYNWLWRVRGEIDRWIGGVGFRRGRRHPDEVRVGDAFDFWRVEAVKPDELLRLRAEMKLPGRGWLQFKMERAEDDGKTLLTQTAYYAPKGLWGTLYWYFSLPFHMLIFGEMIRELAVRAEALEEKREGIENPDMAVSSS